MLENLTRFSIIRFLYKKLMTMNGITNVVIIMINKDYITKDYRKVEGIEIFKDFDSLKEYTYGDRLKSLLQKDYFSKGSLLFAYVNQKHISGFTWCNENFDPNGDVSLLNITNYHIAGPTFVEKSHRGQGLSGKLKNSICAYAKEKTQYPIYAVNSFDNIPIIKNNYREGYRLHKVIIKQKNKEPIIL